VHDAMELVSLKTTCPKKRMEAILPNEHTIDGGAVRKMIWDRIIEQIPTLPILVEGLDGLYFAKGAEGA